MVDVLLSTVHCTGSHVAHWQTMLRGMKRTIVSKPTSLPKIIDLRSKCDMSSSSDVTASVY
jgi:hypothetical protein